MIVNSKVAGIGGQGVRFGVKESGISARGGAAVLTIRNRFVGML